MDDSVAASVQVKGVGHVHAWDLPDQQAFGIQNGVVDSLAPQRGFRTTHVAFRTIISVYKPANVSFMADRNE
jgi:hypothetical protein